MVAALAAAATVAAISVATATLDGAGDTSKVDVGGPVDQGAREDEQLVAGWLPADLTTDEPLVAVPAPAISLTGQVLRGPTADSEFLVVEAVAADGERYSDQVWTQLMSRIGATWGDDGHQEASATSTDANLVLGRGTATEQDVHAVFSAMVTSHGVPLDTVTLPDGWPANLTIGPAQSLDWVPGIAATHGHAYGNPDGSRGVDVATLTGDLPDDAAVSSILPADAELVTTPDRRGWRLTLPGTGERMFLWQEAPGVIGTVTGRGLTEEELFRLADGVRPR